MDKGIDSSPASDLQQLSRCCSGRHNASQVLYPVLFFPWQCSYALKKELGTGGIAPSFSVGLLPTVVQNADFWLWQLKCDFAAFTARSLLSSAGAAAGAGGGCGTAELRGPSPPHLCTPLGNTRSLSFHQLLFQYPCKRKKIFLCPLIKQRPVPPNSICCVHTGRKTQSHLPCAPHAPVEACEGLTVRQVR